MKKKEKPSVLFIVTLVVLIIILIISLPLIIIMTVYEFLPHRRRQANDFAHLVLNTLALKGEMEGKELYSEVNSKSTTKFNKFRFYSVMNQLEKSGCVSRRTEADLDFEKKHGVSMDKTFYKITEGGSRRRRRRDTKESSESTTFDGLVTAPA